MTPYPSGFEDEFAFFEAACRDESVFSNYRDWIAATVVVEQAEKVIERENVVSPDRAALLKVGMEPFERAFRKYRNRDEASPVDYPFSAYYPWWARQGMTAFLKR